LKEQVRKNHKMNLATKISFAVGLVLGIIVVLSIAVFRETDSGYLAQVEDTVEENILDRPVATPIIQEVSVSAAGAYTMDGTELYSFRPDKRWPIASITKLMTSLTADELFDLDEVIIITEEMVVTEGVAGGFRVGEHVRVGDLIESMLMVSSNDAAAALAIHYGEDAFVERMNQLAERIGMPDTSYVDPTGLSVQNLSTADDIRELARYIWENEPYLYKLSRRESGVVVDLKSGSSRKLSNINIFVGRDDFVGGKTGSTPEAEGNLLSLFEVEGRDDPVIIVVLGTKDRFGETENILDDL